MRSYEFKTKKKRTVVSVALWQLHGIDCECNRMFVPMISSETARIIWHEEQRGARGLDLTKTHSPAVARSDEVQGEAAIPSQPLRRELKKDKQIPRMLIPAQPKVFPGRIIPWHDKRQADS